MVFDVMQNASWKAFWALLEIVRFQDDGAVHDGSSLFLRVFAARRLLTFGLKSGFLRSER